MIVVLNEDGEEVWTRKIENEPATPAAAIADAGPDPEVVIDARLLADLLRMGMLPEAWIAPAPTREQRELVRYRRKLSQLRAGPKRRPVDDLLESEECGTSRTKRWVRARSAGLDRLAGWVCLSVCVDWWVGMAVVSPG